MPELGDNKQVFKSRSVILEGQLLTGSPQAIFKCLIRSPGQMSVKKKIANAQKNKMQTLNFLALSQRLPVGKEASFQKMM